MRKGPPPHKHARKRGSDRFGLSTTDLQAIVRRIQDADNPRRAGEAVCVHRHMIRSEWFVWHNFRWYEVVYDRANKTVVTILPDGYLGEPPEIPKNYRHE